MAVTTSHASLDVPSAITPVSPKIPVTVVCARLSRVEIISTQSSAIISCPSSTTSLMWKPSSRIPWRLSWSVPMCSRATFEQNPMAFIVVCTDVLTGEAVYHKMERVDFDELEWLRASASMPLASKVVEVGGRKLLDGGVADSIPLEYFESIGYERNVVILTQPAGFVKEPNKLMPLMKIGLRKYPNMIEAMATRHLMYNRELEYVREAEREGRCLVIRPDEKLPIGHICHDPEKMRRVYEIGRRMGERYIDRIKDFYR